MLNRLDFQSILCNILGSKNVYFNPPESLQLSYPAIVYSLSKIKNSHANNSVYSSFCGYMVTIIDKNPDSEIADRFSKMISCKFDRSYANKGLNYFVYTVFNQGGIINA